MARKLRTWYPGAVYHIMARGIRRMEIFKNEVDYQVFLMILKTAAAKYSVKIHAFVLMTNHYHLLAETGEFELWRMMKQLSQNYALYYNRTYSYKGHVFEDRYKAILVEDDGYFLQTSRYIHLNPVKARMVRLPEQYKWTSFRTVMGMEEDGITYRDRTMLFFKNKTELYRLFIEDQANKYCVTEDEIHRVVEGDEEWLPW